MPVLRTSAPIAFLVVAMAAAPAFGPVALASDEVVVEAGDTLTAISKRHGVSIRTLVAANGIADPNRIYVGQRLVLPKDDAPTTPAPAAPVPPAAAPTAVPAAGVVHTVARGENLWSIARFYGVSLSQLVSLNGIADPGRIRAGLRLTIPGSAPAAAPVPPPAAPAAPAAAPAPTAAGVVHTVARGENLWSIARFYGVSLSQLVSLNGIADPGRIRAGLRLTIPGSAPAAAPVPPPAAPAAPMTGMSPWMASAVAQRDGVRQIIVEEATAAGVPVALALAVAWQESGWRNDVVSSAGAMGVMQLMPATAVWVGEAMLGRPVNTRDTRDNVAAGVRLLAHYLNRYDGNVHLVLAAYYQGQTAADRHGVYPVSRPYIASIEALVRLFGG